MFNTGVLRNWVVGSSPIEVHVVQKTCLAIASVDLGCVLHTTVKSALTIVLQIEQWTPYIEMFGAAYLEIYQFYRYITQSPKS